MNPLDDLIKKKPREKSGSSSSNRFSFQVDWAFSKLIELHKAKKEYLIVLDLHDDVVVGDSESAPTKLDFNQVKTSKNKLWTEARLLYRKGGKSLSILGKLYSNKLTFPDHAGTLTFVSESRCDLPFDASAKDKTEVFFAKLDPACKGKIIKQLKAEHNLGKDPQCDDCLRFLVTDLTIDKHWRDVQGELSEFCKGISPDGTYPVAALYATIGGHLRRRSDMEQIPDTIEGLIKSKAIGSSEVQEILDKMTPVSSLTTLWLTVKSDLTAAGLGMFDVKAIHSAWNKYGVNRRDPANKVVQKLRLRIMKAIAAVKGRAGLVTAVDLFNAVIAELGTVPKVFAGDYLKGAILLEFNDEQYEQLPSTNPKSKGAAA